MTIRLSILASTLASVLATFAAGCGDDTGGGGDGGSGGASATTSTTSATNATTSTGTGDPGPCAGKVCGAECNPCPPGAEGCPAVVGYCAPDATCSINFPVCPDAACATDADCPAIEVCQQCPDDSCATMKCETAQCVLSCD